MPTLELLSDTLHDVRQPAGARAAVASNADILDAYSTAVIGDRG